MRIEPISNEEFQKAASERRRRGPVGQNRTLLTRAATETIKLVFEDEKKAISKLVALSVVRKKMLAQVAFFRRGAEVFLGPGEYTPTVRKPRAK
jgi:hypothetical protein